MSQKQIRPGSKKEEQTQPQEYKKKPETTPPKGGDAAVKAPKGTKTKEDMDKLLDEIDDVLEENAEEFVRTYVQRGGE